MPLPKIEDARNLSDEELTNAIVAAKRELFDLRFQKATGNLEKTHQFKHKRHWISQLMTVERERQLAGENETPAEKIEPSTSQESTTPETQTENQPESE
ncbi:MAG: 50S ribosomal protein L29 [Prochloraceae cyanobacterium]